MGQQINLMDFLLSFSSILKQWSHGVSRVCLNLARYEGVLSAQTCTHLPTEDSAAAQVTQNMALQKVHCYNDYNIGHLVSDVI